MKIKNFAFSLGPSGGLDIIVKQTDSENAQVIASLHTSEEDLFALLASLGLVAADELEEDELLFEDEAESEDSEDEEEA